MPDPTSDTLNRVHARIAAGAPADVWSRADFLDIASPNGVEKALQRLAKSGDIRRPCRGLYDKPTHKQTNRQDGVPSDRIICRCDRAA